MQTPQLPRLRRITPAGAGIGIARATLTQASASAPVIDIPSADAFSVIVQLKDFRHHKLWRGGQLLHAGGHRRGEIAITDMRDGWRCQHLSAYDNVRFHLPRSTMDELSREGGLRVAGLNPVQAAQDPVVFHLAQAVLAGDAADTLFFDTLALALHTHLASRYGRQVRPPRAGGLAAWQEARARDYLMANLARRPTLTEIAQQCGLSSAHFTRAFKISFGLPAYAWLQQQRVDLARRLLAGSDKSMPQIALDCGFSDQSHFIRVFKRVVGVTPMGWVRSQGGL
jgi:AraC family transcriptional regulator